jgi:hypothetical protein
VFAQVDLLMATTETTKVDAKIKVHTGSYRKMQELEEAGGAM